MKYVLTLLLFFSLFFMMGTPLCTAQYENVWTFGDHAGVDFNRNPPQAIRTGINTLEGSASICDGDGRLLFYTDGSSVWDSNHNIMFNGNDLTGLGNKATYSTNQACCIVSIPGQQYLYYIFSLSASTPAGYVPPGKYGHLYFSVVDMSLNSGLGGVVAGRKGVLLDKELMEHMTAIDGENCTIWLMVLSSSSAQFKAYKVGINGIDTVPVVSAQVANVSYVGGSMDIASNGRQLVIGKRDVVLYDFSRNTGKISNPLILDKDAGFYGVCFSPDNSKIYSSGIIDRESHLYQYDLSAGDSTAIIASKVHLGVAKQSNAIKRGPDGKMYCVGDGGASLDVIHQPNIAGVACQYVKAGLPLLYGTHPWYGLPNAVVVAGKRKLYSTTTLTGYCSDSFLLEAKDTTGINYVWADGGIRSSRYVKQEGTYWVSYQVARAGCYEDYIDTFHTVVLYVKASTTAFEGQCTADTFLMSATNVDGHHYTWEDGSTGSIRKMNRSGTFWVSYKRSDACELFVDTFRLFYPERDHEVSFTADTIICFQELLSLDNSSDPNYQDFEWSFGDGLSSILKAPDHLYADPGAYEILLTGRINDKCVDTAVLLVQVDPLLPVHFTADRKALCVGDFISVSHQMNSNTITQITWQWGDGHELWASRDDQIRHAYDSSGWMAVTMAVDFRACRDDSFSLPVQVFALPEVLLYSDQGLCYKGMPLTLKNLREVDTADYNNLWSTGSATNSIVVTDYGQYSLTVSTEPLGCSTTETVEIIKDCYIDMPNAFTPNGDGVNDYFFPRQLLTKSITSFRMKVLNRWGQVLFETDNLEGRGWDGKVNGKHQPQGVYMYAINLEVAGGRQEQYNGTITLVR